MMGILTHVGIVHGAELIRVLALVLCDVSLVNPSERFHEPDTISTLSLGSTNVKNLHVVKRRTDVSCETHEEEWQLQDRMFEVLETIHDFGIPS
jgi:hypothetical protein